MMKQAIDFDQYIELAVNALKNKQYLVAEKNMREAIALNPHSPAPQNLFGILNQLMGNDDLARKHYRAAYSLDPTYKPAIRNLDSVTSFNYRSGSTQVDFGDRPEAEKENPYTVVYDEKHIGHLIKKSLQKET